MNIYVDYLFISYVRGGVVISCCCRRRRSCQKVNGHKIIYFSSTSSLFLIFRHYQEMAYIKNNAGILCRRRAGGWQQQLTKYEFSENVLCQTSNVINTQRSFGIKGFCEVLCSVKPFYKRHNYSFHSIITITGTS